MLMRKSLGRVRQAHTPSVHVREYKALAASDHRAIVIIECIPYMGAAIENNLLNGRVIVPKKLQSEWGMLSHATNNN